MNSQQRKEVRCYCVSIDLFRFTVARKIEVAPGKSGHILENGVLRLPIPERCRRWIVSRKSTPRSIFPDHHETVRFFEGQRSQQDCIHQAEDRRVSANAEPEREHGHGREAGVLCELAKRVAQIVKHCGSWSGIRG